MWVRGCSEVDRGKAHQKVRWVYGTKDFHSSVNSLY